jgi:hypothetical protein
MYPGGSRYLADATRIPDGSMVVAGGSDGRRTCRRLVIRSVASPVRARALSCLRRASRR